MIETESYNNPSTGEAPTSEENLDFVVSQLSEHYLHIAAREQAARILLDFEGDGDDELTENYFSGDSKADLMRADLAAKVVMTGGNARDRERWYELAQKWGFIVDA